LTARSMKLATFVLAAALLASGTAGCSGPRAPAGDDMEQIESIAQREFESRSWIGVLDYGTPVDPDTAHIEGPHYVEALPADFSVDRDLFAQLVDYYRWALASIVTSGGTEICRRDFQFIDGAWELGTVSGAAGSNSEARALIVAHFGDPDLDCREIIGPYYQMMLGKSGDEYAAVWYYDAKMLMWDDSVDRSEMPDSMTVYTGEQLRFFMSNEVGKRGLKEYWH